MSPDIKNYIDAIEKDQKRQDALKLVEILQEESGYKAYLSGKIISFGTYHYKYESGREGDACVVGFAPAKAKISIYIMPGFSQFGPELEKLGKHKTGKCCLYINKLADVDETVLRTIVRRSVQDMQERYPCKDEAH